MQVAIINYVYPESLKQIWIIIKNINKLTLESKCEKEVAVVNIQRIRIPIKSPQQSSHAQEKEKKASRGKCYR